MILFIIIQKLNIKGSKIDYFLPKYNLHKQTVAVIKYFTFQIIIKGKMLPNY